MSTVYLAARFRTDLPQPGPRGHGELRACGQAVVEQVAGEHPDPVAAHLGDAAVGVAVVHEPLGRASRGRSAPARRIPSAPSPVRRSHSLATRPGDSTAASSGSGRIRKSFPVPWPLANRMT